jgi:hypothetical protein
MTAAWAPTTSSLVDGTPRGAAVFKVPSERISAAGQGQSTRSVLKIKRCAAVELHWRSASITATGSCRRKGAFCRINVREQRNVRQSLDVAERWLLFEFKAQGGWNVTHLSQAVG